MRPARESRQHQHTDTLKNILSNGNRRLATTLRNKNNIKNAKNKKKHKKNNNKRKQTGNKISPLEGGNITARGDTPH